MGTARRKIINVVYMPKWTDLPDGGAIMEFMPDRSLVPRTRSAAKRGRRKKPACAKSHRNRVPQAA
jgi:hypothetical protein